MHPSFQSRRIFFFLSFFLFFKFFNASFGTYHWVWVDEGNGGAGCVGTLCLLFRSLSGDDGLFLVWGGGTKDVFVKEIVPEDLL